MSMIVKKITKERASTSNYSRVLRDVIDNIFKESGITFKEKERKETVTRPLDSLAYISDEISIYLFKMKSIDRVVFEVHFSSAHQKIIEKHILESSSCFYSNEGVIAEKDFINKQIQAISIIAFDFSLTPDDKLLDIMESIILEGDHLDVELLCCLLLENHYLYNHHLQKLLLKRLHLEKKPETVALIESVLIE